MSRCGAEAGFVVFMCDLGEGEHVEVSHTVLVGEFDSLLALLGVDHLPHVLGHKIALGR